MNDLVDTFLEEGPVTIIQPRRDVWISVPMDAPAPAPVTSSTRPLVGDGSAGSPYCGNTLEQLRFVMRVNATATTEVHLGPGVFLTRDYVANALLGEWLSMAGQNLTASPTSLAANTRAPRIPSTFRRFYYGFICLLISMLGSSSNAQGTLQ
jgi:hypothetical protein